MADGIITKQELIDAKVDAQTLEDCINGAPNTKVQARLGREYWTLSTIDSVVQLSQSKYQELIDAINTIVVENGVPAMVVVDSSGVTQQEINDLGGVRYWTEKSGGYQVNNEVRLSNGDIVKSTEPNNTNNPNVNMTGWRFNDNTVESIADLIAIQNPKDGQVVYIKDTDSHFIFNGEWSPIIINKINLSTFPRLAPEIDDTGRFLRASEAVKRFDKTSSLSTYPVVPTTFVEIPPQEYFISDTIDWMSFVHIVSDGKPTITMSDSERDIFSFPSTYSNKIKGIIFQGGRHHIRLANTNTDATKSFIDDCEFHMSSSYAIYTEGVGGVWTHLSALIELSNSLFIKCNKAIRNVADKFVAEKCWFYPSYENFTADSAYILNKGVEMHINECLGVPVMGGPSWGVPRVQDARWIDNYGGLICNGTRFGLESDGMVIVNSYGGLDDFSNNMGSFIHIKDCTTAGGVDFNLNDNTQIGIVRIKDKIPRQIYITDNTLQLSCPAIVVENEVNLFNYITSQPNFKRLIDIKVHSNQSWQSNGTLPNYPSVLSPYVNKGLSDVDLMTLRPHVFSQNTNATSNAWFSYPIPIGVNNFTMLLTVRGNPYSSTAGSMQQQSSTYVLKLETFKNEAGQTVRYITSQLLLPYVEPEGVAKNDYRPEVKTWFGESFSENPSVEIISSSKTTADFFTVRVFSAWNAVVTLVPLDMGADGYWKQGGN